MNVTIKIDDELCKSARHRAVDSGLSLSGWIARMIRRELTGSTTPSCMVEALGCEESDHIDNDFPRDESKAREVEFS